MYGFNALMGMAADGQGKERRRSGRVACSMVTCQYGDIIDLSRLGVRVKGPRRPELQNGTSGHLSVTNAAGESLSLPVKAIWQGQVPIRRRTVGFEFLEMDAATRKGLADLAQFAMGTAWK